MLSKSEMGWHCVVLLGTEIPVVGFKKKKSIQWANNGSIPKVFVLNNPGS